MDSYFEKQKKVVEQEKPVEITTPVELSEAALLYLNETRKWTMFIGVFYIVLSVFLILIGLVVLLVGASVSIPNAGLIGLFYLILSVLLFVPMLFLIRFSRAAKRAVTTRSAAQLEEALKQNKFFFIATGVMVIIGIIFTCAFLVTAFTMGVVGAVMQPQKL
jgi:hypothetical protein